MALDVDMTDPAVRALLEGDTNPLATGKRSKQLVHQAGDFDHGLSSTTYLDRQKREVLVYYKKGEQWLTVDVYSLPGEPVKAVLICPRCQHVLRVSGDKKKIEWDALVENPLSRSLLADPPRDLDAEDVAILRRYGATGKLSIETFECTWEIAGAGAHVPGLVGGGMTLCRWRAAIDRNIAKDA